MNSESQTESAGEPDPASDTREQLASLTLGRALRCGLTHSCPACGRGRLFSSWFKMNRICSRCGFLIDRPDGYYLGSTYINYGVVALLTTISYVVLRFGLGWEKQLLLPGLLLFCLIFPLVFFRFARSLWLAFDCYFDRAGAYEAMSGSRPNENEREVSNKR